MNKDILDLITVIENDSDLENISIVFEDGFEIDYSHECFNLWKYNKSQNRYEFYRIYDNIVEDLLNSDGIIEDGNIYKFKWFEYVQTV